MKFRGIVWKCRGRIILERHKLLLLPCGYALPRTSGSLQFRVRVMNCSVLTEDSDCRCIVAEGSHAKFNQPTKSCYVRFFKTNIKYCIFKLLSAPITMTNRWKLSPNYFDQHFECVEKQTSWWNFHTSYRLLSKVLVIFRQHFSSLSIFGVRVFQSWTENIFFCHLFLSFIQTQFSRSWETFGQKVFYAVFT